MSQLCCTLNLRAVYHCTMYIIYSVKYSSLYSSVWRAHKSSKVPPNTVGGAPLCSAEWPEVTINQGRKSRAAEKRSLAIWQEDIPPAPTTLWYQVSGHILDPHYFPLCNKHVNISPSYKLLPFDIKYQAISSFLQQISGHIIFFTANMRSNPPLYNPLISSIWIYSPPATTL